MSPQVSSLRACRAVLVVLVATAMFVLSARLCVAQQQEGGMLDRMNNADRTMAFPLSNKNFGKTVAYKDKTAPVKTFSFSKGAAFAGDGSYRTKTFNSAGYRTKAFDAGDGASAGRKSFAQNNKLFGTTGFDVRDARDAGKSAPIRAYDLHSPFIIKGKRQDTYDELLKSKQLTIDQVRELLNKNQ